MASRDPKPIEPPMTLEHAQRHLPDGYVIRTMRDADHAEVSAICAVVYPTERPYTEAEL